VPTTPIQLNIQVSLSLKCTAGTVSRQCDLIQVIVCIVLTACNKNQRDALFILIFFQWLTSTFFEQVYFSSLGDTFLHIQQLVCVMRLYIQGDHKVSVNLMICTVIFRCTETFWSPCIYIYIYICIAGLPLIIRRNFLHTQQLICVMRLYIQSDQKVSVNLMICSVIVRYMGTFWTPVHIYIEQVYCSSSGSTFCIYSNWYVSCVYIYRVIKKSLCTWWFVL